MTLKKPSHDVPHWGGVGGLGPIPELDDAWMREGPKMFHRRPKPIAATLGALAVVGGIVSVTLVAFHSKDTSPTLPPPAALGRASGGARTSSALAAPATSSAPVISWSVVGGIPVPVSSAEGPRTTEGGRAVGFSHDAVGAALAAVNISFRLVSDVGPQVYEPTVREQCFGDVEATLEQVRHSSIQGSVPSEFWYKIVGGDPAGDLVLISIAVKAPQSGGYVGSDRTLRWVDGDWRMQVPPPRPWVIPIVSGYTLLGRRGG